MRKLTIGLLALLIVVAGFAPAATAASGPADATQDVECEYPLTTTDATGEEVTLEESPESVVALHPSDAQTAFEIGAEDEVVAMPISSSTDYLDAGDRTDITEDDGFTIDPERVIDAEPDVVLAANVTDQELIDQLRESGLTVYHFHEAGSIDDIEENVRITGQLTGNCDGAEETVSWMTERLDALETALEDEERPLAYYTLGDGYTPGANTFQHEMLASAGLENVALRADMDGWGIINSEVVVEEDPEWIIYSDWAEEPPVADVVQSTTAYENEDFVAVDDNYMSQPGPRIVDAIEAIAQTIHPEAYEEAQAALEEADETETEAGDGEGTDEEATADEANETEETETDVDTDTETDDETEEGEDSIPGFGVPVAVAALLASLGLLSRRE